LITDNGMHFNNYKMREYYQRLHIDYRFSSISHPQTNDQAKLTNIILLKGLKKIKEAKSEWVKMLYEILWA